MAEVGLVGFAQAAFTAAAATLPSSRSKYSKHKFTQLQLLAILCLMRFEDWTFREAEVRAAMGLSLVPDYTTLYLLLKRLDETSLEHVLAKTVESAPVAGIAGGESATVTVAVDATGLAPGEISTFFVLREASERQARWGRWRIR